MDRRTTLAGIALLLPLLGSVSAALADDLQAGLYEIEVRLELPHIEDTNTRKTVTLCLSPSHPGGILGLAVLSENNPLVTCPVLNTVRAGEELTFDIVCKGINQAKASARYLLAHRTFRGRIAMQMGGKNMTMTEVQIGRRLGECPVAPPPS